MTAHPQGSLPRRFTVAEVEAMVAAGVIDESERVELIGGELVPMSRNGNHHEIVKIALLRRWYRSAPDDVELAPETTFRLSTDTYLEPDVVLFDRAKGLTILSGDSVYLVVEVFGSSLRYDIGRKAALYASFGVRELWVIDAVSLHLHLFRDPSVDGYRTTLTSPAAATVKPIVAPPVFALRLADLDLLS